MDSTTMGFLTCPEMANNGTVVLVTNPAAKKRRDSEDSATATVSHWLRYWGIKDADTSRERRL
jgi:hypothetical protein